MKKVAVDEEIERLRQFVIESRTSTTVEPQALKTIEKLNKLYEEDKTLFSPEDARWLNVLKGNLSQRLESHKPKEVHTKKAKRKGDQLDHCWRCMTPIDERFTDICPTCSEKPYMWRICPICQACGCQRLGNVLI